MKFTYSSSKLMVFPLQKELSCFLDYFKNKNTAINRHSIESYSVFEIDSLGLICAIGGHGKVQFGIHTQFLISKLQNIDSVICAGAGGGLSDKVATFDVVLGEKTLEHDYKEKFNQAARVPVFNANCELLNQFSANSHFDFKVHTGIIASGDEDIVDPERAQELFLSTKALSVAWEGVGGARAASFNKKPFLEVRGITDNAREDVSSSYSKNLPVAMKNIASLFEKTLSKTESF